MGGDGGLVARRRADGPRAPCRTAAPARDEGRLRPHVAAVDPRRSAARPVRVDGAAAIGGGGHARRRRVQVVVPAPVGVGRRRAMDRRRRGAARRRPRGARPEAGQARQDRRRRRDAHVRPHRDRRGPGPHPDAAQDGGSAFAQRLDDGGRRHRSGDRTVGTGQLGRGARPSPRPQAGTRDRVVGRVPDPVPDHGTRQPCDGGCHAGAAGAHVGSIGRRRPAVSCVPNGWWTGSSTKCAP